MLIIEEKNVLSWEIEKFVIDYLTWSPVVVREESAGMQKCIQTSLIKHYRN